jgi:hypothetical protein
VSDEMIVPSPRPRVLVQSSRGAGGRFLPATHLVLTDWSLGGHTSSSQAWAFVDLSFLRCVLARDQVLFPPVALSLSLC